MKSILVGSLLLASSALVVVGGVTPAWANTPADCVTYPANAPFSLTASPTQASVAYGASVKVAADLTRGPKATACEGFTITSYVNGSKKSKDETGSDGLARFPFTTLKRSITFSFLSTETGARSSTGTITVAPKPPK